MRLRKLVSSRASLQILIILLPCYGVAYVTDKMVYVVPTLAATIVASRAFPLRTDENQIEGID